jgi:DNA-binding HxlR family transcriptional regulator
MARSVISSRWGIGSVARSRRRILAEGWRFPIRVASVSETARLAESSPLVVLSLDLLGGRARFSVLQRAIPGISQRMLATTLKNLERDGLVFRELFPEVLARVEYEITDLGKSLLGPTQGLVDWVKANWEQVRGAQSNYDAK